MIGVVIGDIAGSRFEHHNHKSTDFELFHPGCRFTDDTVMSMAVAAAFPAADAGYSNLREQAIAKMQELGNRYPHAGYGGSFRRWLCTTDPQPYNSWGNGSAMRVSACAYVGNTLDEVKDYARIVTEVTHNHSEGIKGAEAVAVAVYMARSGRSKQEIRDYISEHYYAIDFTLDAIRDDYFFDVSCQGSVPQALQAFFESTDFESAIRLAVSIGGDSDTIAAIAGSVAGAYYGVPDEMRQQALAYMDPYLRSILHDFEKRYLNITAPDAEPLQSAESPRYTPEYITELQAHEVFVFGSNLAGCHGGGAAHLAHGKFGAIWGQGEGLQGQSYAIPTMQGGGETIAPYVDTFISFARNHPELHFLVTRIGCGIAGFRDEEIAPLFRDAFSLPNVSLPESFHKCLTSDC